MERILVQLLKETSSEWAFKVVVKGATEHDVTLSREYWKELTGERIPPEKLVERSFEFLLEREPKESILGSFDLPLITRYFPEYEEEMTHEVQG